MTDPIERYRDAVSAEMQRQYGITWAEACGDTEPLARALDDGETPADFADRWGSKYGLDPVTTW